ncbi:MAG: hypothetical protein DWQ44_02855 [Bacteroidetes bacterium]|nr:MAG: hypothetical protein DWQ33_06585 [Bacteroidota bacterium]REK04908.1 MAG: hypothetical protein DWQ39_06750 [Bacteroidota bacterium]REK36380.1 MAG: hypothetical protein DWQ44_02855 [Bacteroidota bacterium]REK50954.1 MAG: hypothetical protein DWQ48_02365 [Bacteroidota bacterium]
MEFMMMKGKRRCIFCFSVLAVMLQVGTSLAQGYVFPLNRDINQRIGSFIDADTTGFHSSIQPWSYIELQNAIPLDSILAPQIKDSKFHRSWVGRKLRSEHLLLVDKDDIILSVDPVLNLQLGRDNENQRNVFINTRGALVQANVKDKFFFYSGFRENQARFVGYVDSLVRRDSVVPGQGKVKFLKDEAFDFSQSFGGIAYRLDRHFDFLLAHDKNFIGNGYRSLLLSDNSYNYPFLRVNMTFWKFRYSVYYAVMQDLKTPHDDNIGFFKKYSTTHYLNLNIGKKNGISVGIFETVMWKQAESRGYELHYLNPMLFLRPVENSLDSPDNALLGLNYKIRINRFNSVYGQVLLDEFLLDEVRDGNGWWGNKQGLQFGFKSWNIFRVSNLNLQCELNFVRPFTYQHRSNAQDYTHYNQPLAHPLGANFFESVSFLNYRYKNIFAELKFQYAKTGQDTGGVNLGNDIFRSYESRITEYGHEMFQGVENNISSAEIRIAYLVNPKTNFNLEFTAGMRKRSSILGEQLSNYIGIGLRMALENYYWDF